jgi:hypothetical protein
MSCCAPKHRFSVPSTAASSFSTMRRDEIGTKKSATPVATPRPMKTALTMLAVKFLPMATVGSSGALTHEMISISEKSTVAVCAWGALYLSTLMK